MELFLIRKPTIEKTTIGELFWNGDRLCFTLEDAVREIKDKPVSDWKFPGETAIPIGKYQVIAEESPRFGKDTLTLKDVPGFIAIRMHSGNTNKDTEGCIIVGESVDKNGEDGGSLLESKMALSKLKNLLIPVIKAGTKVTLEIQ